MIMIGCLVYSTLDNEFMSRYGSKRPGSVILVTVDDGVAPATSVPEPDMKVVPSSVLSDN